MTLKKLSAAAVRIGISLMTGNTLVMGVETSSIMDNLNKTNIERKLREQGVPSNLKTGRDLLNELISQENQNSIEEIEPRDAYNAVLQELLNRHEELYEKAIFDHDSIPISDHCRHILTPSIIDFIPSGIINEQFFNPSDTFFDTAIKLERLGLAIKDLHPAVLTPQARSKRHVLMAHCFAKAGHYVEQAVKTLKQNPYKEIDLLTLTDMYQTGGLFYHWAAVNMPPPAKDTMDRRSEKLYGGLKMIQMIYKLMSDLTGTDGAK